MLMCPAFCPGPCSPCGTCAGRAGSAAQPPPQTPPGTQHSSGARLPRRQAGRPVAQSVWASRQWWQQRRPCGSPPSHPACTAARSRLQGDDPTAGSEARTAGHRKRQQSRAVVNIRPAAAGTTGARPPINKTCSLLKAMSTAPATKYTTYQTCIAHSCARDEWLCLSSKCMAVPAGPSSTHLQ